MNFGEGKMSKINFFLEQEHLLEQEYHLLILFDDLE